jgi:hypothetical protein
MLFLQQKEILFKNVLSYLYRSLNMFFKNPKTNMELEISEQSKIFPTILANYERDREERYGKQE